MKGGSRMEFMLDKKGEGYLKEQVDAYVQELRQTYQQLYEAHQVMVRQYEELEQRMNDQKKKQQQVAEDAALYHKQKDAIAQALIQAQTILSGAQAGGGTQSQPPQYPGYPQPYPQPYQQPYPPPFPPQPYGAPGMTGGYY